MARIRTIGPNSGHSGNYDNPAPPPAAAPVTDKNLLPDLPLCIVQQKEDSHDEDPALILHGRLPANKFYSH